jgi:hypothetical protein
MDVVVSWAIGAVVTITLIAFVVYLIGLRDLPMGHRPKTPTYNRLGQIVGLTENPDFHVNPGEEPNLELEAEIEEIEREDST